MDVDREPCSTCPYRKDTAPGIWHEDEYAKLAAYDDNGSFATFLCHQGPLAGRTIACRGWLTVHCESVAVRLGMATGAFTLDQVYAKAKARLYRTGRAAMRAGMKGIKRPSLKACQAIQRIVRKKTRLAKGVTSC